MIFFGYGAKLSAVPNCPFFAGGAKLSGAKLSWCQIVRGAKLSAVPNCPRCQIVLVPNFPVPNCPGAKLSVNMGGAKLSAMPNCPGAKLS